VPFYEYHCDACEHQFEVMHGINEKPDVRCERCQGEVRKVFFAPSVIFHGGGFYATEYGRSTHNNPKKSSSSSEDKPSPAPEKKDASPAPPKADCASCPVESKAA
jgi:putative FmdB family regulatory protein